MNNVVNVAQVREITFAEGISWCSFDNPLTPTMPKEGLGVNHCRVPSGASACPCHTHQIKDEVFFVLSGRGLFRYGDEVIEIGPGDCLTCPAGTGTGHQIANPFDEDLAYLAIGGNSPNEVCTYPDTGRITIDALNQGGFLEQAGYFERQPDPPLIMSMPRSARSGRAAATLGSPPSPPPR